MVSLREYLADMQDMLRSSLRGDIAIRLNVPADLWKTKVDLDELELAILNIAVNARDAMPNGGCLTIEAWNVNLSDPAVTGLRGPFVGLSLSDTGDGIPADVLPRIFEPFFTTKDIGKGTGLGLSQVYGFARQSGGTATARSEPGRGSTVTLYLPRTTEETAAEAARPSLPSMTGQGRILLVEDNADIAEVTRSNLEELGFRVVHVPDAHSALNALERDASFDLVFTDIVMPGDLTGVDLARTIRLRYPALPVLLTTGYSNMAQAAADEGFSILHKPYDSAGLSASVNRTIRVMPLKASA